MKKAPRTTLYTDFGTPEFRKKKEVTFGFASEHQLVSKVKDASMLDFYFNRHHLVTTQYDAGIEFTLHWNLASKEPNVTANYCKQKGIAGSAEEVLLIQQEAEKNYIASLKAMAWPKNQQACVVFNVCLMDEKASRYDGLYGLKGMNMLRKGLDILADFYGIT
jgi:hypothetical protein